MSPLPPIGQAPPALVCENLTLGYDRHPAVHHLSLSVPAGSLMAIVGPNGAGKSTLLKAIAGEMAPLEGRLLVHAAHPPSVVAYLAQQAHFEREFPLCLFEFVAMGLWDEIGAFGGLDAKARERVHQALAEVGLSGFSTRPMSTLSGGQVQRARFARLALQDAEIILLDEPFAALDAHTTETLLARLFSWHAQGKTLMVVLHDLALVRRVFPLCLLLAREPIAFGPTEKVLLSAALQKARWVSEAFDETAPECHRPPSPEVIL